MERATGNLVSIGVVRWFHRRRGDIGRRSYHSRRPCFFASSWNVVMITLVTGTPGAGKSAYAMSLMLQVLKEGRPLFVHGVPGMTLPHVAVSCESPTCKACNELDWPTLYRMPSAEKWIEWIPDGAVLFFDEVQNVHRPRPSGSKVPEGVARYETHRHSGIDAFFVTQHPKLVDVNVTRLVGRHVHLISSWKGRTMYDWPETSETLSNKADAIKSSYKLPKHVFSLYKSASLHVKPIRRLPPQLFMMFAMIAVLVVIGFRLAGRYYSDSEPVAVSDSQSVPIQVAGGADVQTKIDGNSVDSRFDFNPAIPNVPESAPAFAGLAKPVSFPQLAGCVVNRQRPETCRCYTQQGTPYFVSQDMCVAQIDYGRFNPYKPDTVRGRVADTERGGGVSG